MPVPNTGNDLKIGTIIIPIVQMKKLRCQEVR